MSPAYQYPNFVNPHAATIGELLARQGDIRARQALTVGEAQARAAEQSGQAWGAAIGNIGQSIAAIPQQIQQQKQNALLQKVNEIKLAAASQEATDLKSLDALYAQPGGFEEILKRTPGHLRSRVVQDLEREAQFGATARQSADKARKDQDEYFGLLGSIVRQNNYDPAYALGAVHKARERYADNPAMLQQLDQFRMHIIEQPDSIRQMADAAIMNSSFRDELKPKAPVSVAPGASLVDPLTGKPIYTAPERSQRPVSVAPGGTLVEPSTGNVVFKAPPAPEKAPKPEGLTPNASLEATLKLRDRFVRETTAARTVEQQFNLMKSSMEAVNKGDMAAGSQGVLVTFQKILDPTSVVRESEYARSGAGQSLLNRLQGQWENIVKGGAKVPPAALQKFVNLAQEFVRNQATAASQTKEQIDAIAKEYGLKPENITRELGGARKVTVTAPDGSKHDFDTQAQADAFKTLAGIK